LNKALAAARFTSLIGKSSHKKKSGIKTNPTQVSNQKRIETKKRLSEKKKMRRYSD